MRLFLKNLVFCLVFLLGVLPSLHPAINIGRFDNPQDLFIRITNPYASESPGLLQPITGSYSIFILPGSLMDMGDQKNSYTCHGLFYHQIDELIYIDIRKPPKQKQAGFYDMMVSLHVPDEEDRFARLPRSIRYVDTSTDVMLIIDNSSSMKKTDPRKLRYTACENFIHLASLSNRINQVSLIRFSSSAKVILPWTTPKDIQHIGRILNKSRSGNFTNINAALELGANLFEESLSSEKVLILLTDGKSEPDRYRNTHRLLQELGVRVITVGLSEQSDEKLLKTISEATGGNYFKATDDKKLLNIYNHIVSEISHFRVVDQGSSEGEFSFDVTSADEILNINLFGYQKGLEFNLIKPSGEPTLLQSVSTDKNSSLSLFRLVAPQVGRWIIRSHSQKNKGFNVNINTAGPLFLKIFPLEKKYLRGELVHFAASLAIRDQPILNNQLEGRILDSDGSERAKFTLFDDGVHGDNHSDDGVYGAIYPLDLPEGFYSIVIRSSGENHLGEKFSRLDKRNFHILDTDQNAKDYFLASVLPLYIDLGEVEQGGAKSSNLRLSFQGRHSREIEFLPSDNISLQKGEADEIPWSQVSLPKIPSLNPSEAHVFQVRFNIPPRAPVGAYSGSIDIALGDRVITIPVDLVVTPSLKPLKNNRTSHRQLKPREIELSQTKTLLKPSMQRNSVAAPNLPASTKSEPLVVKAPPPPKPFHFEVLPLAHQSFTLEEGQEVTSTYTLVNRSTKEGLVSIFVTSGPGSVSDGVVRLNPGEQKTLTWNWTLKDPSSQKQIQIQFKSEHQDVLRSMDWKSSPKSTPWAFYATLFLLFCMALFHGSKFISSHRDINFSLSLTSLLYLAFFIWTFRASFPKTEKLPTEEHFIEVELFSSQNNKAPASPSKNEPELFKDSDKKMSILRKQKELKKEKIERLRKTLTARKIFPVQPPAPRVLPERTFAPPQKNSPTPPTPVLSVNDRPHKRARMKKRVEVVAQPTQLSPKKANHQKEALKRKNTPTRALPHPKMPTISMKKRLQRDSVKKVVFEPFKKIPQPHKIAKQPLQIKNDDTFKKISRKQLNVKQNHASHLQKSKAPELQSKKISSSLASKDGPLLPKVKPATKQLSLSPSTRTSPERKILTSKPLERLSPQAIFSHEDVHKLKIQQASVKAAQSAVGLKLNKREALPLTRKTLANSPATSRNQPQTPLFDESSLIRSSTPTTTPFMDITETDHFLPGVKELSVPLVDVQPQSIPDRQDSIAPQLFELQKAARPQVQPQNVKVEALEIEAPTRISAQIDIEKKKVSTEMPQESSLRTARPRETYRQARPNERVIREMPTRKLRPSEGFISPMSKGGGR